MPQEELQQGEVLGRQIQQRLASPGAPGRRIQTESSGAQYRWPRRGAAPDERSQPGGEFSEAEWFGQIVICATVQPADPIGDIVSGGQHQHRHRAAGAVTALGPARATTMTAADVQLLLDSCDRGTDVGVRDFAIMKLVARFGPALYRGGAFGLRDLGWRAGELVVRGKARRQDRLPLPSEASYKPTDGGFAGGCWQGDGPAATKRATGKSALVSSVDEMECTCNTSAHID